MFAVQSAEALFEAMFNRYYEPMCRFVYQLLKDADATEDLVQNVFIKDWEKREELDFSSNLKPYLFQAAWNAGLNQQKKNSNWLSLEMDEDGAFEYEPAATETTDQALGLAEASRLLELALNQLPEGCRLVFNLSRQEGLSYKEIAETLGISVKTVENQMSKALLHLRKHLKPYLSIILYFFLLNNNNL